MTQFKAKQLGRKIAKRDGLQRLTQKRFCLEAGIPPGSLHYRTGLHFYEILQDAHEHIKRVETIGAGDDSRKRMPPSIRREILIETGIDLIKEHGMLAVDRALLADTAGVTPGLISHYFGSMRGFFDAVMIHAISIEDLDIIRAGLTNRNPVANTAPQSLKRRVYAKGQKRERRVAGCGI